MSVAITRKPFQHSREEQAFGRSVALHLATFALRKFVFHLNIYDSRIEISAKDMDTTTSEEEIA